MKQLRDPRSLGWLAVAVSAILTCFWAFWGIAENFHEGWYYESLLSNLGLMLVQYLSPMFLFMGVTVVSLFWPRLGACLHLALALLVVWFFRAASNAIAFVLMVPLLGLGASYWYGRPQPRRLALAVAIGLPLVTLGIAGIAPAVRVSQRHDDGNLGARLVEGNGVALIWAPEGPGWPRAGMDWHQARRACQHLRDDGLTPAPEPQLIWRLPTIDEAVRSMARHGQNSAGTWDAEAGQASYATKPDKESPLWNPHSQVIYWWTETEIDQEHAYIIVYDGRTWQRLKHFAAGYMAFRCVRKP